MRLAPTASCARCLSKQALTLQIRLLVSLPDHRASSTFRTRLRLFEHAPPNRHGTVLPMTRLGIVSDTHAHVAFTRQAVIAFSEQEVDEVIHCGDIGSAEIPPLFAHWPAHFVFGNVDHRTHLLEAAIAETPHHTCHGRYGQIKRDGRKIAMLHSDDQRRFDEVIHGCQFDLVCYGHTHCAKQERVGDTLVLNPGAVYRADPHTVAIVDLPQLTVTWIEL